MTATQLKQSTRRTVSHLTVRDLTKVNEFIEDLLDAREADRIMRRMESSGEQWVPWETVEARLEKRFACRQ